MHLLRTPPTQTQRLREKGSVKESYITFVVYFTNKSIREVGFVPNMRVWTLMTRVFPLSGATRPSRCTHHAPFITVRPSKPRLSSPRLHHNRNPPPPSPPPPPPPPPPLPLSPYSSPSKSTEVQQGGQVVERRVGRVMVKLGHTPYDPVGQGLDQTGDCGL
ncbi:hypothetical protein E2C01_040274 [Portunus trituberculatus]|uniref:Uncharacterized protein n=1 Tax=Portunus trituberculatus TaxID=210409 RepID=A0A5B7FQB9_PORTR|nr:hypothetical protein [Portunus trituberculatus]